MTDDRIRTTAHARLIWRMLKKARARLDRVFDAPYSSFAECQQARALVHYWRVRWERVPQHLNSLWVTHEYP
jgi:hypothetical protein